MNPVIKVVIPLNSKSRHMPPSKSHQPSPLKILIVDDESLIRFGLEKFVKQEGFTAFTAGSGTKALNIIEDKEPDIVLLDMKLQDSIDGLEILKVIKNSRPEIIVIMISGQRELYSAVAAMKLGARDYQEKPIDFDKLRETLNSIRDEMSTIDGAESGEEQCVSEKMRKVFAITKRLAVKSDLTILILGESGTGKNYLCQKIHEMSNRRDHPYLQIGCSNIPEHLIESELFGYEKGAFTDARNSKKGLIEVANGGTVLLDELGDMPYQFQSKILKLLEEKSFRPIGALDDIVADVRILAATNHDLNAQVQHKEFRLDLFYRLNIATIELPPLRERPEDIPVLVDSFLKAFCRKYDTGDKVIDKKGMKILLSHPWPGNVRQLKNLVEKLVVLSDGELIAVDDIRENLEGVPLEAPAGRGMEEMELPVDLSLEVMEERFIRRAMEKSGGNQRKAADLLGLSRDALRYRLKKMGL
ncbi:Response regulator of zinc sigma-54-dependent two-component system [hydrothermal vent metagenome]|uniref:Response regulator of zinc sigma-54-dependent two-component system n=1 Tax=hydrothermal vent metagenome TaxID=652676 RepID=A0A3B0V7W0_9ZZZZ